MFEDDGADGGLGECPKNVIMADRPRTMYFEDVENLTVRGITFRDAAFWTLHMAGCRHVVVDGIRILNDQRGTNNDGINPDTCQDVVKICYFSMWNILEKIPELSEHLWEKNMEQIAEGWFLDLQEFLEVWSSVKGGGNTKRRWLYMYPVFWFDEPKSVEVWKRKKTPEARCGRIAVLYP